MERQQGKNDAFDEAFCIAEAETLPFQRLDSVVQTFDVGVGDASVEVVEDMRLPVEESLLEVGEFRVFFPIRIQIADDPLETFFRFLPARRLVEDMEAVLQVPEDSEGV